MNGVAVAVGPIEAERRVIAPDMIGYGNSSMHDGFDRSLRAREGAIGEALDRANHWVTEDRPDAYRDHLAGFLL